MNLGYARVSTQGQTLESQLEQLGNTGCARIYKEVASAAKIGRPQLQAMLKALEPGAVVVVTRLDRLARSTIDLLTTISRSEIKEVISNHLRSLRRILRPPPED